MNEKLFDQKEFLEIEVLMDGSAELDAPAECTCTQPAPDPGPACCNSSNVAA
jgi:hypothetical protein